MSLTKVSILFLVWVFFLLEIPPQEEISSFSSLGFEIPLSWVPKLNTTVLLKWPVATRMCVCSQRTGIYSTRVVGEAGSHMRSSTCESESGPLLTTHLQQSTLTQHILRARRISLPTNRPIDLVITDTDDVGTWWVPITEVQSPQAVERTLNQIMHGCQTRVGTKPEWMSDQSRHQSKVHSRYDWIRYDNIVDIRLP